MSSLELEHEPWDKSILKGHKAAISALASHPRDFFFIGSGSDDGTSRLWDLRSQKCVKCFVGSSSPVASICFDTKLDHVLYVAHNHQILAFDTRKEGVIDREAASKITLADAADLNSISMHQKERLIVVADDAKVSVFDLLQSKSRHYSHFHSNIVSKATFRPGSSGEISSCGFDYRYCLWDYRTGKAKFYVDFSTLSWGDCSATVISDGLNPPFPHDFAFLDRGKRSAVALGDGSICVVGNADGGVLGRVRGHGGMVTNIEGNLLSEFVTAGVDKTVKIWKINDEGLPGSSGKSGKAETSSTVSFDLLACFSVPHKVNSLSCAKNERILSKPVLVGETNGEISILQLKMA